MEVIERFFFNRVDAESRRSAIGRQYHLTVDVLANKTGTALTFVQTAVARAKIALESGRLTIGVR